MINNMGKASLTNRTDTTIGEVRVVVDRTGSLIDLTHGDQVVTLTRSELEQIMALVTAVTE